MTPAYTVEQVRARLSEYIAEHGRQTTADRFGVSVQYLGQVLAPEDSDRSRPPGPAILKGLGLIRAYVPAPTPTNKERP